MAIEKNIPRRRRVQRKRQPADGRILSGFEPIILDLPAQRSTNGHIQPDLSSLSTSHRTPKQLHNEIVNDQKVMLSGEQIALLSEKLLTLEDLSDQTKASLEFAVKYYPTEQISDEMIIAASRHSLFLVRQAHEQGQLTDVRLIRTGVMNPESNEEKPKINKYEQNRKLVEKASKHPLWQEVPGNIKTFFNLTFLHSEASTARERISMIQELAELMGTTEMEVRIEMKQWLEIFKKL